ncbi:MAG: inositol monophosphatase family protein, partial [Patescibacteria group bacterium]
LSSNWDVIIDGLDGTKNFLAGIPLCVVGITVAYNGEFVYAAVGNPFDGPDGTLTFGELGS